MQKCSYWSSCQCELYYHLNRYLTMLTPKKTLIPSFYFKLDDLESHDRWNILGDAFFIIRNSRQWLNMNQPKPTRTHQEQIRTHQGSLGANQNSEGTHQESTRITHSCWVSSEFWFANRFCWVLVESPFIKLDKKINTSQIILISVSGTHQESIKNNLEPTRNQPEKCCLSAPLQCSKSTIAGLSTISS